MLSRSLIPAGAALLLAAQAGCGYPTISWGNGGNGGDTSASSSLPTGSGGAPTTSSTNAGAGGTATTWSTTSTSSSTTSTSTSSTTTTTSSVPTCPIDHLLISEIRTRGPKGASDEFIELYNPTDAPVTLDGNWTIEAQALGSGYQYSKHWTGPGLQIAPRGHFLITGSTFGDGVHSDSKLSVGLTDGAGVRLLWDGYLIDAVCFYPGNDPASALDFAKLWPDPYSCEGLPIANPHNANESADASIERKPGGLAGNCKDTNSNARDWVAQSPSTPLSSQDAPTP